MAITPQDRKRIAPPERPVARAATLRKRRKAKRRLIFWSQISLVIFLMLSIGMTIRAMEIVSMQRSGVSWLQEIERGNYNAAAEKFSLLASDAVDYVFDSGLSTEMAMRDFNAALPHLKQAGYTLTELELELGIPPKLIPHFYHDPAVRLDLKHALTALEGNSIGTALMYALAKAGDLQQELEVSDMQFSHIEVELGPVPSLKLQYKNPDSGGSAAGDLGNKENARACSHNPQAFHDECKVDEGKKVF